MTIKKLLIANRGEIASRIMLSAHDMGISCVAIYTEENLIRLTNFLILI